LSPLRPVRTPRTTVGELRQEELTAPPRSGSTEGSLRMAGSTWRPPLLASSPDATRDLRSVSAARGRPRRLPGADLLLGDAERLQRGRLPAIEGHLHEDLLDLRGCDADVERALEVAAQVIVPAQDGQGRDRQHAVRLEVESRPRIHAAESELVGEPQQIV